MKLPDIKNIREKYIKYSDDYFKVIIKKYGYIPKEILLKKSHGISMSYTNLELTKNSNLFNESYYLSSSIEGCLHDIGRFEQFYLSGSFVDKHSQDYINCPNHGVLGKLILERDDNYLLRYFLPRKSNYDFVLKDVIENHTVIIEDKYKKSLESLKNTFVNYSISEVINSSDLELINKLISLKIKLIQESDSLELIENIINNKFSTFYSNEKCNFISKEIMEDFINYRYIDISKYKEKNLWTCNSSFALRCGLITNKFNLVTTLEYIKKIRAVDKMYDRVKKSLGNVDDSNIMFVKEYTKKSIDNLIQTSDGGIFITEESRSLAKQKTKSMLK